MEACDLKMVRSAMYPANTIGCIVERVTMQSISEDEVMSNSMLTTTIANDKNFGQKVSGFTRSAGNIRDGVQDMVAYGLVKYRDHGDAGSLSRLYAAAVDAKGVNAGRLKEYIVAHANVKLTRDKQKNPKFVKASKDEPRHVEEPTVAWYNFQKESAPADPTIHVAKRLDSIATAINNSTESGKPVNLDGVQESLKNLQGVIANMASDNGTMERMVADMQNAVKALEVEPAH